MRPRRGTRQLHFLPRLLCLAEQELRCRLERRAQRRRDADLRPLATAASAIGSSTRSTGFWNRLWMRSTAGPMEEQVTITSSVPILKHASAKVMSASIVGWRTLPASIVSLIIDSLMI